MKLCKPLQPRVLFSTALWMGALPFLSLALVYKRLNIELNHVSSGVPVELELAPARFEKGDH
jgi:hypothetical protein